MNSVCLPIRSSSPDDWLSACFCQTCRYCSGRLPDIRFLPTVAAMKVNNAPAKITIPHPKMFVLPVLRATPTMIPAKVTK